MTQGLIGNEARVGEWDTFVARDFGEEVRGLVLDHETNQCCGVSLGGLGTGCIDVLPTGVLGFSTLFPVPRRHPAKSYQPVYRNAQLLLPFLGLSIDGVPTVLATEERLSGGRQRGCVEPGMGRELTEDRQWVDAWSANTPAVLNVKAVRGIRYWGHYPMVDLDYEIEDPVAVSLRAWSPFVPGDVDASNTPGAVFEVTVANTDESPKDISLVFSFPGILDTDPLAQNAERSEFSEAGSRGITVAASGFDYTIATQGHDARSGYGVFGEAWTRIATDLPQDSQWSPSSWNGIEQADTSASLAVDFSIEPGEETTVTFILSWNAPEWFGAGFEDIEGFERWDPRLFVTPGRDKGQHTKYRSRYTERYRGSRDTAAALAVGAPDVRGRIVGWQSAFYIDPALPDWLPEVLINSLNLLTKDSFWAAPSDRLGEWSFPIGGFGMSESPRGCDITGCIVSNWYGDFPLLYFFPELEMAVLRNYKAYVRPDGAVPFLYPSHDLTRPTYEWLIPLNGPCFVDLVGRLWRRTRDLDQLRELYPTVKATTQFTVGLRGGDDGAVGVHMEGTGQEWWEHTTVKGLVTHAAGVRLATIDIAGELAEVLGDVEFATWCKGQVERGSEIVEESLWNEDSYVFFSDPDTGEQNADILSSQLDGDWIAGLHGRAPVFNPERSRRVLETILELCSIPCGLIGFVPAQTSDEISSSHSVPADAGSYGSFTAEMQIVAMTMMYSGMVDEGRDLAYRALDNLFRVQGHAWDLPNMVVADTCERYFGTDYFQNLALWALPAALEQKPLQHLWGPDGLVTRVLAAGVATPVS